MGLHHRKGCFGKQIHISLRIKFQGDGSPRRPRGVFLKNVPGRPRLNDHQKDDQACRSQGIS